jgi:hypothetical protein
MDEEFGLALTAELTHGGRPPAAELNRGRRVGRCGAQALARPQRGGGVGGEEEGRGRHGGGGAWVHGSAGGG